MAIRQWKTSAVNSIPKSTQNLTRAHQYHVAVNTTSTFYGRNVIVKAVCNAPIPKTVPVRFYQGANQSIGTAYFDGLTATLYTNLLTTGTNTAIRAEWPGEGRYEGFSESSTQTVTVAAGIRLGANIGIRSSTIPAITGSNIVFTFTATTTTNMAGTSITLLKDNQGVGQATFNSYNTATVTYSFDTAGTYSMKGTWLGGTISGNNYEGQLTNVIFQDVVNAIQPIVYFTSTNIYGVYGKGGTVSAVLGNMGGYIDATGTTVTIYDNETAILTSATTNNLLSIPISQLSTGTHNLTASFSGNTRFLNATSVGTFTQYIVSATSSIFELRSIPGMPYSSVQGTGKKITFLALTNVDTSTNVVTFTPDQTVPSKTKAIANNIAVVEYSLDSANPESNGQILPFQYYGTTVGTGKAAANATIAGSARSASVNFDVSKVFTTDANGRFLVATISGVRNNPGAGPGWNGNILRLDLPSWHNWGLRFECVTDGFVATRSPSNVGNLPADWPTTDIIWDNQPGTIDNGWLVYGGSVSSYNHPVTWNPNGTDATSSWNIYITTGLPNKEFRVSRNYPYKTGG